MSSRGPGNRYECPHCNKIFASKSSMTRHISRWNGSYPRKNNVSNRNNKSGVLNIREVLNRVTITAGEFLERLQEEVEAQIRRDKSLQTFKELVFHLEHDIIDMTYVTKVILEISRAEHVGVDLNLYDQILLRTSIKHNHSEVVKILEKLS